MAYYNRDPKRRRAFGDHRCFEGSVLGCIWALHGFMDACGIGARSTKTMVFRWGLPVSRETQRMNPTPLRASVAGSLTGGFGAADAQT